MTSSTYEKLLGLTINNKYNFEEYVRKVYKKANRK